MRCGNAQVALGEITAPFACVARTQLYCTMHQSSVTTKSGRRHRTRAPPATLTWTNCSRVDRADTTCDHIRNAQKHKPAKLQSTSYDTELHTASHRICGCAAMSSAHAWPARIVVSLAQQAHRHQQTKSGAPA